MSQVERTVLIVEDNRDLSQRQNQVGAEPGESVL